jgi:hypothetical protein
MIFIVNRGFPWYLRYVGSQIRMTNPNGEFHMILDRVYPEASGFDVIQMERYSSMAKEFEGCYKSFFKATDWHLFELIWFQRYMFVLEYLESLDYKGDLWILDSDVMVYSDLSTVKMNPGIRFTRNKEQDPCFSWFADTGILREFCEYILDFYRNKLAFIENYYRENYVKTNAAGGICEMTFLRWFADEHREICQDLSIPVNGFAFDRGMHEPDGFERTLIRGKKIRWRKGLPWAKLGGQAVGFHGLHCQGDYKHLIPLFFSGRAEPRRLLDARKWLAGQYMTTGVKTVIKKILGME